MMQQYKVLLPRRVLAIRDQSRDKFIKEVKAYLKRYPHYEPKQVKGNFAICIRKN